MTEDEIVEYATHSPENTNPAVLRDMLGQLSGGGGAGLIINITEKQPSVYIMDKTAIEIVAAIKAGTQIQAIWPNTEWIEDEISTITGIKGNISYDTQEIDSYSIYVARGESIKQFSASEYSDWYPELSED